MKFFSASSACARSCLSGLYVFTSISCKIASIFTLVLLQSKETLCRKIPWKNPMKWRWSLWERAPSTGRTRLGVYWPLKSTSCDVGITGDELRSVRSWVHRPKSTFHIPRWNTGRDEVWHAHLKNDKRVDSDRRKDILFTVSQTFVRNFFKLVVSKNKKGGSSMKILAVSARTNEDSGENIFNDTFATI